MLAKIDKGNEFRAKFILILFFSTRHFSQLNIMFVGGPNSRKDYHIEEGEEVRENATIHLSHWLNAVAFE